MCIISLEVTFILKIWILMLQLSLMSVIFPLICKIPQVRFALWEWFSPGTEL